MKKSDYKFAECVIIMLSLGYHLLQSQKQEFVFFIKSFSCFQGVQSAPMGAEACPFLGHPCFQNKCFAVFMGCNRRQWGRRHVPFWGILVSKINGLPFSGGATGANGAEACPKMSKPFFWKTRMSIFGT